MNEDLAFELFNKQLLLAKQKNKRLDCSTVEAQIFGLKQKIQENSQRKLTKQQEIQSLQSG